MVEILVFFLRMIILPICHELLLMHFSKYFSHNIIVIIELMFMLCRITASHMIGPRSLVYVLYCSHMLVTLKLKEMSN